MVAVDAVRVVAWIIGSMIALAVYGGACALVYWTWRKTRGRIGRRLVSLTGVAVLFVAIYGASRVAP